MLLLYWVVTCVLYLASVWWLARKVPEQQYPLLRQLYWGTSGLSLLGVVVPVLTLWDWTFRYPSLLCLLLLASGVLAGTRQQLRLARLPALAAAQAVLVGLAAPLLLPNFLEGRSNSIAYADSDCTVTVTDQAASWMDEKIRVPEVEIYSTRLLLFEKNMGHVSVDGSQYQYSTPRVREWWQGVSSLTFAADSNRGVVWRNGATSHFSVNTP